MTNWSNYYFNSQFYIVQKGEVFDRTFDQKIANAWPFGLVYHDAKSPRFSKFDDGSRERNFAHNYMYCQSVIGFLPAQWLFEYWNRSIMPEKIELSQEEKIEIDKFFVTPNSFIYDKTPRGNLLFLLVESLESWPLQEMEGKEYMPYLHRLISQEHVFYAPHVKSQIRHGISGDGQLIYMTGLLPVQSGAACILYGDNCYPNFASAFPSSVIFNPVEGYWNQEEVTTSYGFKQLIQPHKDKWNDAILVSKTKEFLDTSLVQPFCVLSLTISSHMPFKYGADHPKYQVNGMPKTMIDYLNCLAYTDSCIMSLVEHILQGPLSSNTTIVITGDHTAFRSGAFQDMDEYAEKHNIPFRSGHTYVPFIVYSPYIGGNERYEGESYQMDIYPTVCALLDSTVHVPSFGVDLRDSSSFNNRKVSEAEAYRLSDLIIRSNYFEHVRNDTIDCQ